MEIKPGIYKHYKGNKYEVIGTANHSETLQKLVIYKGLYNSEKFGNQPLWARPAEEFLETINIYNKQIKRFTLIK